MDGYDKHKATRFNIPGSLVYPTHVKEVSLFLPVRDRIPYSYNFLDKTHILEYYNWIPTNLPKSIGGNKSISWPT